jgi:hypothetical protein
MKILAVCLFIINLSSSYGQNLNKNIAFSKKWLRLLHYKSTLLGGYESYADGENFFLAEDGKTNPISELEKNLEFYKKNQASEKEAFKCRFPARYEYLKKIFSLKSNTANCKNFNWWKGQLKAKSLALVYATNYPNNPMSAFGHTFLRVLSAPDAPVQNSRPGERKVDLLDYMVGFAAEVPDVNGLVYAYKGLFGGFVGQFHMGPYYLKINEYNNMESRDLWEYHLNFTPEETGVALDHLWELAWNTHFDYYFLDENCSFHIMAIFEVAKLDWDLIDKVGVYLSPAESVKIVQRIPGAIIKSHFRPSTHQVMQSKINALTKRQKQSLAAVLNKSKNLNTEKDPYVLEAAASYLAFKKGTSEVEDKPLLAELKNVLIARSKLKITKEVPAEVNYSSDPLGSHGQSKVQVAVTKLKHQESVEFKYRMGLHGNYDDPKGYARFSKVEFGSFSLSYLTESKEVRVKSIQAINMRALVPWTEVTRPFSWGFNFKYDDSIYTGENLNNYEMRGEFGLSLRPFSKEQIIYLLSQGFGRYEKLVKWDFTAGVGAIAGQLYYIKNKYPLYLEICWQKTLLSPFSKTERLFIEAGQGLPLTQNTQVEIVYKKFVALSKNENQRSDLKFGLSYYF